MTTKFLTTDGREALEREVANALGKVESDVTTREFHPTFITKSDIKRSLERAEHLVQLFGFLTGAGAHSSLPANEIEPFGPRVVRLRELVKNVK